MHEDRNQKHRGHVNPDIGNERNIDGSRDHDGHHLPQLAPFGKQAAARLVGNRLRNIDRGGEQDRQTDIEWEEAGLGSFGSPADAGLDAPDDNDQAEGRYD